MPRAVGSSFEVVRPSGCVRLCLLVFVNILSQSNNVLVKLIHQSYAGSVFCLEIFLCLKASRHCVPAESNVIHFTVVKEWLLIESGMLERTTHWFFTFTWEACSMLEVNVAFRDLLLLTQMQV